MTSDEPAAADKVPDGDPIMLDSQACSARAARLFEAAATDLAIAAGSDIELRRQAEAWQRLADVASVQEALLAALAATDAATGTPAD